MAGANTRALYWCFTVNNPSWQEELPTHPGLKYASWQLESGENGTHHIQGYAEFRTRQRMSQLKKWLPTAHFEPRRGTAEQAREYTRKSDTRIAGPYEFGEFDPVQPGQRNDLEAVQKFLQAGGSEREVAEQFPDTFARHPQFIRFWLRESAKDRVTKQTLDDPYPWQKRVLDLIETEPDDRQILWVFDPVGGRGKTMLGKYLVDFHGAFYTNGGKHTDIVHAYQGERVVIFDYVRESEAYVNYGVIEQLKNGIMFSPKYESGMKRFDTPHVVVFSNFYPATGKLSNDRLVVIKPVDTGFWVTLFPAE